MRWPSISWQAINVPTAEYSGSFDIIYCQVFTDLSFYLVNKTSCDDI